MARVALTDDNGALYGAPATWLNGQIGDLAASKIASRASALSARVGVRRWRPGISPAIPDVITGTTTETLTTGPLADMTSMTTHPGGVLDPAASRINYGMNPLEFVFRGTEVEIKYIPLLGDATKTEIWVDDQLISAEPLTIAGATGSTQGFIYLKWNTLGTRKIRMVNFGAGLRAVRPLNASQQVLPVPATPTLGVLADSFGGPTTYVTAFQAFPAMMSRELNANFAVSSVGGSGYISGGGAGKPYGEATRLQVMAAAGGLDGLVFFGSINDKSTHGTIQQYRDAARTTWDAYAAQHPNTPLVVFGREPSGSSLLGEAWEHEANRALMLEAEAHPAVVAFVDMLGTAHTGVVPPTWTTGVAYNPGDLVIHKGAIFRCALTAGTSTNQTPDGTKAVWVRVSWVFTGTGKVGATVGDGNRDFFLGDDGVHPTEAGSYAFGQMIASSLVRVLGSGESFTYYNV